MHDTLELRSLEPIHRQYHHHELTFAMIYAYSENFVLPISHDEVVYGKGSMLRKMPGDRWEQLANLRAYFALHVEPPRQAAALHGQRVRAVRRVGRRSAASTGGCSTTSRTGGCTRWSRTSTTSTASHPALWELDSQPDGLPLDRRQRRLRQRLLLPAVRPRPARTVSGRSWPAWPTSRAWSTTATGSACRRAASWREILNTDSRGLRRRRARQPRRDLRRGGPVARPAVLRDGPDAEAVRGLVRADG